MENFIEKEEKEKKPKKITSRRRKQKRNRVCFYCKIVHENDEECPQKENWKYLFQ